MSSHLLTNGTHAPSSLSDALPPVLPFLGESSISSPGCPALGQYTECGVCLLRAVFVMSENLVIYSMFLCPVISHHYSWPTWQPSDKGAMFNHYASYYFKFHIVCLRSKFPPSSLRTHTYTHKRHFLYFPPLVFLSLCLSFSWVSV